MELLRGVVVNVVLLLGFVLVCSLVSGWMVRHRHKISVCSIGILFGAMAVVSMFSPVFIQSGMMLDCRAGVIGTAALLGGVLMALPSLILPSLYQIAVGGPEVGPGVSELFFAAFLGTLCHMWVRRKHSRHFTLKEVLLASVVVGLGTDLAIVLCYLRVARQTVGELGLAVSLALLFLIPVSMALLSIFILREQYHEKLLDSVADSEQRMLNSQRMAAVGQLSNRVAHSILNALAIIMGNAELAKIETNNVQPILDDIIKTVDSLSVLTGELVAFSSSGELRFQRMDLSRCLIGVERLLAKVIGAEIEVVVDGDREVGKVNVDPNLIEQIILHMALNSYDAMEGKGRLSIGVASSKLTQSELARLQLGVPERDRVQGKCVVLSVQDTGCGMTEEVVSHIFEPFFTTKGRRENSGLGLSSVYNIVQKHHGFIDVKTQLGRGTTFSVYLPCVG